MNIWIYWVSGHITLEENVSVKRLKEVKQFSSVEKIEIEKVEVF